MIYIYIYTQLLLLVVLLKSVFSLDAGIRLRPGRSLDWAHRALAQSTPRGKPGSQ